MTRGGAAASIAADAVALVTRVVALVLTLTLAVAVAVATATTAYAQQPGPKNGTDCTTSAGCERAPPNEVHRSGMPWRTEIAVFAGVVVVAGIGYRVLVSRMAREP